MKVFLLDAGVALGCLMIASGAIAQTTTRKPTSPVPVTPGVPLLKGDERGAGDTGKQGTAPTSPGVFPTGPVGDMLRAHMNAMTGVGTDPKQNYQDAEIRYQASLRRIRQRAPEVAPVLAAAYDRLAENDYFRRWAIVETLRELQNNAAAGPLVRIATSPIPPERIKDDPERSSIDEEIRIRVTAVEGLSPLAKANTAAEQTLLRLATTRNPHIGIQRAAIRGYLAAAPTADEQKRRSARLKAALPPDRQSLITLATTDVRKIPHPEMPAQIEIKKKRPPQGPPPKPKPQ